MTMMGRIGASTIKKTKFVTAVSEIARNAVIYGHGGVITFSIEVSEGHKRVIAECSDRGPGIADLNLAMKDGFTSGKGLGLGLSGAKRLVDRFDIVSTTATGTTVTLICSAR